MWIPMVAALFSQSPDEFKKFIKVFIDKASIISIKDKRGKPIVLVEFTD